MRRELYFLTLLTWAVLMLSCLLAWRIPHGLTCFLSLNSSWLGLVNQELLVIPVFLQRVDVFMRTCLILYIFCFTDGYRLYRIYVESRVIA